MRFLRGLGVPVSLFLSWAVPAVAQPPTPKFPAPACYRFERHVRWRDLSVRGSIFKTFQKLNSYYTQTYLDAIFGSVSDWAAPNRSESLYFTRMRLTEKGLRATVEFAKNDWPLDVSWDRIWVRRIHFELFRPWTMERSIGTKAFKIEVTLFTEHDSKKCPAGAASKKKAKKSANSSSASDSEGPDPSPRPD